MLRPPVRGLDSGPNAGEQAYRLLTAAETVFREPVSPPSTLFRPIIRVDLPYFGEFAPLSEGCGRSNPPNNAARCL